MPLFLFHLLEFMGVEFEIDVDEINERWTELASSDLWSQMIIKETSSAVELITAAPPTGQYVVDRTGALVFRRAALDWHQLQDESECFFLRVYGAGDYRWKGADLGVLVTKGRLQTEGRSANAPSVLTIRAKDLIDSTRARYAGTPVAQPDDADADRTGDDVEVRVVDISMAGLKSGAIVPSSDAAGEMAVHGPPGEL
jgi:hypothetical protein